MARWQAAWGIDIGTTALKAMKIRREGDKVFLEALEHIEHRRFLHEPDVDRKEVVRESLARFLEVHPLHGQAVYIAASGATSFARFVKLPPVEPKKIPEIVRFEAIQQIPFPLDQVNWDYHPFRSPDSPDVEIGIFAIKTDLVTQLLADFRNLGITVHGVQVAPLAVYNAMMYEGIGTGKGTVVIDIGADHSDLIVMDQGRLWLRNINLGGNAFTESLVKTLRMPFKKAESLKRSAATNKYARHIFQAMRPTFADIVAEIQRSIGYYNSSHRESQLEQIIGMGNPFRLANLQKYLQQYLGMPVQRLEGFNKLEAESKLAAALSDQLLGMPVAYGLALQAIGLGVINTNLLPLEIARQMLWRNKYPWFAATAALFVLGTAAAATRYFIDSSSFQSSVNPDQNPQIPLDNQTISDALDWKNEYNSLTDTYQINNNTIRDYLNKNELKSVWPQIISTIFSSLPQASPPPNGQDPSTWKLVIQSMQSSYEASLVDPAASGSNSGQTPAPQQNSYFAQMQAAQTQSGFLITITGYTSYQNALEILQNFYTKLQEAAPQNASQNSKTALPFYITVPVDALENTLITELNVGGGANGGASNDIGFKPWGSGTLGPFSDVFVPDFLPPPATQPSGNLPQQNQGPAQPVTSITGVIDPDTKQPLSPDATAFKIVLLVYLRNH
ncbi:MAG TPA: type IV pilus assembly protein PilM [Phycisphaerae bacterium]|nr:type IV pilus assembly protein PilM [Phycisphaerae bacterium]